jgi:hypothetical protein
MKILLIASEKGSIPYVPELITELRNQGDVVDILHMDNWELISESKFRIYLVKEIRKFYKMINLKSAALKKIVKLFLRYDAVNIHYGGVHPCLNFADKVTSNLIVTIWGSDFLRASDEVRYRNKELYNAASVIAFNNKEVRDKFTSFYRDYHNKCKILRWGIGNFEKLKSLSGQPTAVAKRTLGLDIDKISVCIGYNAGAAQQHEKVIEAVSKLDPSLKEKTQLILPLTYGEDYEGYIDRLKSILNESGYEYHVFESYMNSDDVVMLRQASDIVLNFQVTDSFSASIQEHLLVDSQLFVGDWLPYDLLSKHSDRIKFFGSVEEITPSLAELIDKEIIDKIFNEAIYNLGTWKNNIREWRAVYKDSIEANLSEKDL